MRPRILAEPGEPLTITLSTIGSHREVALFTHEGEPVAAEARWVEHEEHMEHHHFEPLPEGVYWALAVIAGVHLDEKSVHMIYASAITVSHAQGVLEYGVGSDIVNFSERGSGHLIEDLAEAGAPERVRAYAAALVERLS